MRALVSVVALVLCAALVAAAPVPSQRVKMGASPFGKFDLCPLCETEVGRFFDNGLSPATADDMTKLLEKVCALLPASKQAECRKVAPMLATGVDKLASGGAAKYTPHMICSMLDVCQDECCETPNGPEQLRLTPYSDPTRMMVQWTTLEGVQSIVQLTQTYGDWSAPLTFNGTRHTYTKGGWKGWLHRVEMTGLAPATTYYYRVGDPSARNLWRHYSWSLPTTHFTTRAAQPADKLSVAVVADIGASDASADTLSHLTHMRMEGELDLLMMVGDLSYADGFQPLRDEFGRVVQPVAGWVPTITTPGNHEGFFDFVPYVNRYFTPFKESGSADPLYYSVDIGPVHFVMLNTEGPFGLDIFRFDPVSDQYKWLAADLAAANTPARRAAQPFIVVAGHRPVWCSGKHDSCDENAAVVQGNLEKLFVDSKVDLYLSGHVHNYERTHPVFRGQIVDSSKAPVYVVTGSSGCKEQLQNGWKQPAPAWSAFRDGGEWGFSHIEVDGDQLTFSYRRDVDGKVIDSVVIPRKQ